MKFGICQFERLRPAHPVDATITVTLNIVFAVECCFQLSKTETETEMNIQIITIIAIDDWNFEITNCQIQTKRKIRKREMI